MCLFTCSPLLTANDPLTLNQLAIKCIQSMSAFQLMKEDWTLTVVLKRLTASLSVDFVAGGLSELLLFASQLFEWLLSIPQLITKGNSKKEEVEGKR